MNLPTKKPLQKTTETLNNWKEELVVNYYFGDD
jgi:hypothetical protein